MDSDPAYVRDLSHPNLVGAGTIVLNGLGNLLEGLPEAEFEALGLPARWQALAKKDEHFAGLLLLDLCRRTELASNVLGAFAANVAPAMRTRMLGPDWDAGIKVAGGNVPIADLIAMVKKDLYGINGWSALLASVRELPLPEENRAVLRELLASINWEEFAVKAPEFGRVVMSFAAAQARNLDADFQKQIEEGLFKFAGGPIRAKMKEEDGRQFDLHVTQGLLALSIQAGDQVKTATLYFEKIGRLMRVQPGVASLLEWPMRHWLGRLPFEQQRGLRSLWYQLRAQSAGSGHQGRAHV
jgi:hypothetical protein